MLRQSHASFIPIKIWIEDVAGDGQGRLRQKKAKQLLDLIWDGDKDSLLPLFERTEAFQERVAANTMKVILLNFPCSIKRSEYLGSLICL